MHLIETSDYGFAAYLMLMHKGELKETTAKDNKNYILISFKDEIDATQLEAAYHKSKFSTYNGYLRLILKKIKRMFNK